MQFNPQTLVRLWLGIQILLVQAAIEKARGLFWTAYAQIWDLFLHINNKFSPSLDPRRVVPPGAPGYLGDWSPYVYFPPSETDSRSCCPALNALSNHGIFPRDGKNISFLEMSRGVQTTYNLSPSMCLFIPMTIAKLFNKNYWTDSMDLSDLNAHNVIEHDASLFRHDAAMQPDQAIPALDLIDSLLKRASGTATIENKRSKIVTPEDMAAFTRQRRVECQKKNGQYTLNLKHRLFAANNNAIMLATFGGRVEDLRPFLTEERIPQGWQSRVVAKNGLTVMALNKATLKMFLMQDPLPLMETLIHKPIPSN